MSHILISPKKKTKTQTSPFTNANNGSISSRRRSETPSKVRKDTSPAKELSGEPCYRLLRTDQAKAEPDRDPCGGPVQQGEPPPPPSPSDLSHNSHEDRISRRVARGGAERYQEEAREAEIGQRENGEDA